MTTQGIWADIAPRIRLSTEAEKVFLEVQIRRIRDFIFARLAPWQNREAWILTEYLAQRREIYFLEIEQIEFEKEKADLIRRLLKHDSRFSDGDPAKCDEQRNSLVREVRELNRRIEGRELNIEARSSKAREKASRDNINALMDKYESQFPEHDPLRPANCFMKVFWTEAELEDLSAAILEARGSPAPDTTSQVEKDDMATYLNLLSREIDQVQKYYDLGISTKDKIAGLRLDDNPAGAENLESLLSIFRRHEFGTAEDFARVEAEIKEARQRASSPLFYEHALRQLMSERVSVQRQAMETRRMIASRAEQFILAMDAHAVPSKSILRCNLIRTGGSNAPAEPGKNRTKATPAAPKTEILRAEELIAQWWRSFPHTVGEPIPPDQWRKLASRMDFDNIEVEAFSCGKETLSACLKAANKVLAGDRKPPIRTWWDLTNFLDRKSKVSRSLLRILQKRFSAIAARDASRLG